MGSERNVVELKKRYLFTEAEKKRMSDALGDFKVGDIVFVSSGYDSDNSRWMGNHRIFAIREDSEFPILLMNDDRELRGFSSKELSPAMEIIGDAAKSFSTK